jgi:predicted aldo/keto reductase-like oxidoreductase
MPDGSFDLEPMKKMVDVFLDAGFTYFDTAYIYPGSEEALRETLVRRHPRNRFTITTKMPMFLVNTPEDMISTFKTSMDRLGLDVLDFYFLHGINLEMCEKAERLGAWDFMKELKEKGRIRHYGFSFHGTPEELDAILKRHRTRSLSSCRSIISTGKTRRCAPASCTRRRGGTISPSPSWSQSRAACWPASAPRRSVC